MKNKIIKIITLAIFMIVSTVNINNVQAEPEENINNVEEKIQQITNENETEIQKMQTRESTDTPSSIAEGDESEDDEVEGDETEVELTDFSKAQFSLKKDGISDAIIEISGVTPKDESNYYLYITPTSDKPSINSDVSDERIALSYDEETKTLKTVDLVRVTDCVEKDQEIYVSIVEHVDLKDYIVYFIKKSCFHLM